MNQSSSLRVLCLMTLALGVVLATWNAVAASDAKKAGLDELIEMALARSPEMREAEQDVKAAESDLAQAKAGQWMQMDVVGMVGPVNDAKQPIVEVSSVPNAHGNYVGRIKDRDSESIGFFGRLDVTIVQPLYTFGKISHRQDAASSGVEAQKIGLIKKRNEVALNVKELYYACIIANQGKGAAKDADEFISDARSRITRLLKVGSPNAQDGDLYRVESLEAEIQQFKVKADSGAELAGFALKQTVGVQKTQPLVLDRTELPMELPAPGPMEQYLVQAMSGRPELAQLKKGIAARKSLANAAESDLYPSVFLALIGSAAGAPERERFSSTYWRDEFNHADIGGVMGAEWHFDLGIGKGKVAKARAEHQKLQETLNYAEQNIPIEIAKYYEDARQARAAAEAYQKSTVSARRWVVSAFADFDIGTGSARNLLDAIESYGKNQGEYLNALYSYHVAMARLTFATGQ